MNVKTILVPYDFSDYAAHAFAWASELAQLWNARIILLHAVPLFARISYTEAPVLFDIPKVEAELVADGEKQLREFIAKANQPQLRIEAQTMLGDPFAVICQVAERDQVDLIVMGSHGRTGLAHVFMGSVAERVLRHASCPVLVARRSASTAS
ncbi:MAG: universal stress protein [Candidatus Binatia bacterium]